MSRGAKSLVTVSLFVMAGAFWLLAVAGFISGIWTGDDRLINIGWVLAGAGAASIFAGGFTSIE